ncbi:MAG TPA: hypothetical protein VEC99_00575 [Clostridia bacterium]|nr:hypothetical protein [Clostridia bacterium]
MRNVGDTERVRKAGSGMWSYLFAIFWVFSIPVWAATNIAGPDDIPPLRPPRGEIPPTFWELYGGWVIVSAVVALVIILCVVAWILTRPKPTIVIPPAVEARQALEPLSKQPENGVVLSQVSQVVRHYFASVFGLPSEERTTTEFCRAVSEMEQVGPDLSAAVSGFLRECDHRKFAPAPSGPPSLPLGAVPRATKLIELAEARREVLARAAAEANRNTGNGAPGTARQ